VYSHLHSLPFVVPQGLLPHLQDHYWTQHAASVFLNIHFKIYHLFRYVFFSVLFNDTHLLSFCSVSDRCVNVDLHCNNTDVGKQKYSEKKCLSATLSTIVLCELAWSCIQASLVSENTLFMVYTFHTKCCCAQKNAVSHICVGIDLV
jgi:hypothetical protein